MAQPYDHKPGQTSSQPDEDQDHDDQPASGLRKKRIQQACRPCGIKRVKCDGAKPCVTCLKAGEICEYGQPKKRGPPKGSTRGSSKAKRAAVQQLSVTRRNPYEAAQALPIHSANSFTPLMNGAFPNTVGTSSSRPPIGPSRDWARPIAPATASASATSKSTLPPLGAASNTLGPHGEHPSASAYSVSAHASPNGSFRSEDHRTAASSSIRDGASSSSMGSPSHVPLGSSPQFHVHPSQRHPPPHSALSRYDSNLGDDHDASRSRAGVGGRADGSGTDRSSERYGAETFYRGSSSGWGFIRTQQIGAGDRKLPPLDFYAGRSRSATTDFLPHSSPSSKPELNRSLSNKSSFLYGRPSPSATPLSAAAPTTLPQSEYSSKDYRSTSGPFPPYGPPHQQTQYQHQQHIWPSAPVPPQTTSRPGSSAGGGGGVAAAPAYGQDGGSTTISTDQPSSARRYSTTQNTLLVDGTLQQMQRDASRKASLSASSTDRPELAEDPVLDPLLWVEPGDSGARGGVARSGVTLSQPEIPALIQERLFTIFWGIVQTIWPALYKPALCLTGFNIIDPEKHPMLHNAACALAAAAWDSGEAGLSEQDTEATQSDWVERTASDLSFSHGQSGTYWGGRRLSAADLGDIFLVRAKYYLVKTNNEPSLEAVQSLLFMALREGGNGRATQASAYQNTACRMAIDLGLHRQRDFSSVLGLNFSHAEEQARRRIFWCLYLLDKTSSATLGRPVILRDAEIDCPLPNIDEVDEMESWAETTNNSSLIKDKARNRLLKTPVAAMTHLHKGVQLGRICESIIAMYTRVNGKAEEDPNEDEDENTTTATGMVEATTDGETARPKWESKLAKLHQRLEQWERTLPSRLRFEEPAHRLPNTLCQHLWYQVCRIILHRPYILKTSNRPGLPSSLKVCTEAVGKICDILTSYEENFGMRKLSSTFVYCIFTASTIEIANTTSQDAAVALEAKRRLRKFMTWLSRISETWNSATHHLKILEQLGHGIDADLDGTGLPSRRDSSFPGSAPTSRPDTPGKTLTKVSAALGPSANSEQHQHQQQQEQMQMPPSNTASTNQGMPTHLQAPGFNPAASDVPIVSVPGPIGAPMELTRSRMSFSVGSAMQGDLQAQFQAQGQNPGQLFGWNAGPSAAGAAPDAMEVSSQNMVQAPRINPSATTGTGDPRSGFATEPAPPAATNPTMMPNNNIASSGNAEVNPNNLNSTTISPGAFLKLHDTSYWGAMPLASEDTLSWANFTNSYIEALNGMAAPNYSYQLGPNVGGEGGGGNPNNNSGGAGSAVMMGGGGYGNGAGSFANMAVAPQP